MESELLNRVALFAVISVVALLLSTGLGWAATTGTGTVSVENLTVETPYVSGCCALIDDPQISVPFNLYRPSDFSIDSYPIVIHCSNLAKVRIV